MKKNLQMTALSIALAIGSVSAQTGKVVANGSAVSAAGSNGPTENVIRIPNRGCGTGVPSAEWEAAFQKQIQEFLAKNAMTNGKVQMAAYTIPVIIHVIHGGQAVGTYPNLAQAQLNSQIAVLNADYGGTGFNVGTYPATAFQAYASSSVALSASLTAANKDGSGRVAIANTNVQFCLATKDSLGNLLVEPGIERINYISKGWANPTSFANSTTFQTFIDGTVKPQTVWNVSKYLNMWVTDENLSGVGLLGYATFPVASGNTGIPGPFGTASTDGFWAYAKCIGSANIYPSGVYDPTYKYGRTCSHEIGHWLGLRHIWGDGGQCGATDYCVDTPPQKGTTGPPAGCYYGTPAYPSQANSCTRPDGPLSASVKNLNGDMFMNFMDYTDDVAMYMFTTDQGTRIQTTMANSPYRKFLGTHGLCSVAASAPTATITIPATGCNGTGIATINNSTGTPAPTYVWSTVPAGGVFTPNNTVTSPTVTFGTNGNYTVTCVATNSLGSNSNSKPISITTCAALCNDTIMNVTNTATLTLATAGSDTTTPGCSPKAGYLCGSNCYQDKEKAEYFPLSLYSGISTPKVVSVIAIFYSDGTRGTGGAAGTAVSMKLYNGTMAGGPTGTTTPFGTVNTTLGTISGAASTTSVTYCGMPGIVYTNPILKPYRFVFASPVAAPGTNGFFASLKVPTTAGDTAVVMHAPATTGTNWELWSDNSWHNLSVAWGGFNCNMAILPEITCSPVGVNMNSVLDRNVTIMPNPSTGMFNIVTTLPTTQNLNITVTNALGQIISETEFSAVNSNVFNVDLTGKDNGVYFISIRNGEERIVKRVIIAK